MLDRDIVSRRTELFANSFIPASLKTWNELHQAVRSFQSLSLFKNKILQDFGEQQVPPYISVSQRKLLVLNTKLEI